MDDPILDRDRFRNVVRRLVREKVAPFAAEVDQMEDFPIRSYEAFRDSGLLTLALPRKFGGLEADTSTLSMVISEVAKACASSSLVIFPTQAVIRTIMRTGDESQVKRFGRIFGEGHYLAGFCLSEPQYGSDAGNLETRAESQGDHYLINGTKAWVTLGGRADFYLVFVRTGPGKGTGGVSAIIVPKDTPGLSFGQPEKKMGLRGSLTCELFFHNALVPKSNRLLEEGRGWQILTQICNDMRAWGAASLALGLAEGAFEEALTRSKQRTQSGRLIARQQAIQFMLANMKIKIEAVKSLIQRTTALIDAGQSPVKEIELLVSACKCLASDTAMEVTEQAVQIWGAEGVSRGTAVERMMRDAKAVQIFDGSNQIQRIIVARNLLV